ncbi:phage portal protein [Halosimplex halophilum]|uniref:phage portal protein n=1 Tax=Halosimplex halophilum TaxID=2559572 RepID=UPI00107F1A33|nr:phage portal protein [Halosimplex halophilum]
MSSDTADDGQKVAINVEGVGGGPALSKVDSSTQLPDRRIRTRGHGIRPPYNPDRLASFLEFNETHATAVRKKSRYEVGFGFDIVPASGLDAEEADDQQRAVAEDFWRGSDSKWLTAPQQKAEPVSPEEVKELARQDHHSIGWECLEVLTNAEGVPVGLAHVPANTVRVRKPQAQFDQPRHPEDGRFVDGEVAEHASRGYVQVRDGRRRYFGQFGDRYRGREPTIQGGEGDPTVTYTNDPDDDREPLFVDPESGDVAVGDAGQLDNGPANELIFIRNPSPIEQDYGVPDWVSAIRTMSADEAAKDYNRDFFDNDTIPRFVIKVIGGELSEESRRDLKQMLDGLREESHRALILEVEKFLDSEIDEEVDIELEPLGQGISEEMDFREFRKKNEHEIAKVHEVPPILIGVTETSNRSNSEAQVQDFARNVIAPEQHKFAQRLYATIHQTALGVDDWTIEYELRGADQPEQDAKLAEQRVRSMRLAGVGLVNEAREELGLEPFPEDDPRSDMTLAEFEAEVGDDGGGETEAARALDEPPEDHKIGEREWSAVEADLATKDAIETAQFDSSNLDEGLYDYDEQELYLSFKREEGQNSLYAYVDVPATEWSGLTSASSHGSYHYDSIRLEFPYIEITNFHDRLPEGPAPAADEVPDDVPSDI